MKKIIRLISQEQMHWVGDGFPVKTIFTYNDLAKEISPFLLMDYASPYNFKPTHKKLGVGEHPRRGFETVTIVYSGEVEHRDSAGGGGLIKSGDVQWMTAGSGLVHEEFHGAQYAANGGEFEMVQLWVNLPKKFKMTKPRYQGISSAQIPIVNLPNAAGTLRVIAGQFENYKGPAQTFSSINMWDIKLNKSAQIRWKIEVGHTTTLFVLAGQIKIAETLIPKSTLVVLDKYEVNLNIDSIEDSKILFLGGQPLDEPIVGYGPFVMNSEDEIKQAFIDYQNGKMGTLDKIEGSD